MTSKEILAKIRNLTDQEKRNIPYNELIEIVNDLNPDEIIELSNIIGYPVFTRLCMGVLQHKFVLLQDGAAAIIVNEKGQILLQSRADRNKWGLPGGCQELGETFEETIIREVKEETNLDVEKESLELIGIISGPTRRNSYPNGDVVINNTVLYLITKYSGQLKWNQESKKMEFFDLDKLPQPHVLHDPDLIEVYKKLVRSKKNF